MWAVYKKELKSYLLTPIGYVFISIFMVIFSLYFLNLFLGSITNFEFPILIFFFIISFCRFKLLASFSSLIVDWNNNSYNRTFNISLLCNTNIFWRTIFKTCYCITCWILIISIIIYIIWYVYFKYYRKSNNCIYFNYRWFYSNVVLTIF